MPAATSALGARSRDGAGGAEPGRCCRCCFFRIVVVLLLERSTLLLLTGAGGRAATSSVSTTAAEANDDAGISREVVVVAASPAERGRAVPATIVKDPCAMRRGASEGDVRRSGGAQFAILEYGFVFALFFLPFDRTLFPRNNYDSPSSERRHRASAPPSPPSPQE